MAGALSHIRVLDLTRVLAGPWATQFLADMGAEVIKIERPRLGDDTRHWGPPFALEPTADDPGLSAYYLCANRGKHSVTIDFERPEGQALVRRIAETADVVVENFKTGGLAKYGLDYQSLKAVNPSLVYCSITGFGQTGPYSRRVGYDFLIQGMGGLMSLTGPADSEPCKVGVAMSDVVTGFNALSGILAALVRRERTGEGEHIDVALLDCTVAALINQASSYLVSGEVPERLGNQHPTTVPNQPFETADGRIIVLVGNDAQFARLAAAMGLARVAEDERYRTMRARIVNRQEIVEILEREFRTRPSAYWIERLEKVSIPCGPINTLEQVFADPQIEARGLRRELTHERAGVLPVVANPVRFASGPTTAAKAPPMLGEDTATVLRRLLSLQDDEIAELRTKRVL
ncbi:MAG: CaiB/BaiF CoA transferase family protein [Hyphomicrobiaceae bacterium]